MRRCVKEGVVNFSLPLKGERIKHYAPIQEFTPNNPLLNKRLLQVCVGLLPSEQRLFLELSDKDKELIVSFFDNWELQGNGVKMATTTKKGYIHALFYLSKYVKDELNQGRYKSFEEMSREDILEGYLKSLKKDFSEDTDQKWVNTYRKRAGCYSAFWKYLTQPDLSAEERQQPPQIKGLRFPKKNKKTSVKQEHLWTPEEHEVFLQYCEDLRLVCYHAIALETGARPSELLVLKIGDLHFKVGSTGKRYAQFTIGGKGKKREDRPVSISDSLPFYNKWIAVHPQRNGDPNKTYLFPSFERSAKYRESKHLEEDSLRHLYSRTIDKHFTKLLESPNDNNTISLPEHREIIRGLQHKPKFPYLRRHEFASENAPKMSDLVFNQLMGHSSASKMRQVYVKELGNEGNREYLIMKGILTREETLSPAQLRREPKYCPICKTPNEQTAKFCFKCNFVISQEGLWEVKEEEKEIENKRNKEIEKLKYDQERLQKTMSSMFKVLMGQQNDVEIAIDDRDPETQRIFNEMWKEQNKNKKE